MRHIGTGDRMLTDLCRDGNSASPWWLANPKMLSSFALIWCSGTVSFDPIAQIGGRDPLVSVAGASQRLCHLGVAT